MKIFQLKITNLSTLHSCCVILYIASLFSGVSEASAQVEIKANLPLAAVLIPNVGIEFQVGKKTSLQLDVLGSFWNSIDGQPLQVNETFLEFRYYRKSDLSGWFAGVHLGYGMFTFQKPNDLVIYPHYNNTEDPNGVYKSGRSFFHGMTFGYKKRFNKRWAMELFIGGGYAISFYKGYEGVKRVDFENDGFGYRAFNLSGEVLLYRGGLMLVYKILPYKENKNKRVR
jgi:hypothetical protein